MSSNKDFIKIDELFGGLQNHEEKEPEGAWSKMDQLLNEKMPIGTPLVSRSYRFLIPFLLISLSISGYFIWNKNKNDDSNLRNHETILSQNSPLSIEDQKNNVVVYQEEKEKQISGNHETNTQKNKEVATTQILAEIKKEKDKNSTNQNSITASTNKTIYSGSPSTSNTLKNLSEKEGQKTSDDVGKSLLNKMNLPVENLFNSSSIDTKKPILFSLENPIKEPIEIEKIIEIIKPGPSDLLLASEGPVSSEENFIPVIELNEEKIVSNKDGQLFKEEKKNYQRFDLINRREQNEEGVKPIFILDTISIVRIQKLKYIPLNKAEIFEINKMIYGANKDLSVTSMNLSKIESSKETLVPLSNYKIRSKKINTIDAIKNTAGGISNYFDGSNNLALAMFVGGNVSMGNPGAYGMQIGLAAVYSIAERWTVSAELRYGNKYFPQFNFMDINRTFDINKEQTQNGWLFTGKELEETNSYVVKNSSQLSTPIYLSYNFSERLSVLGGLNIAYHFPLKWNKEYSKTINTINNIQANSENPYKNASFEVNEGQDFNSRFSLGYIAGLNYELSRKLSLDARVTQNLWTNGSSNLSSLKGIYQNPSFELSLGFYFGRKDKVIYIMDRKK